MDSREKPARHKQTRPLLSDDIRLYGRGVAGKVARMRPENLFDPYCEGRFEQCVRLLRSMSLAIAGFPPEGTVPNRATELWYPVHPRYMVLLRIIGAALVCPIVVWDAWGAALLTCWLLTVRSKPRPRTVFYRFGVLAHRVLIGVAALIGLGLALAPFFRHHRWAA